MRVHKRAALELAPFIAGFAAIFLLVGFTPWAETYWSSESIAAEGWVFFLAGLLVCALSPGRPFRAAFLSTVGVLVGTAAGVVAHVIVSNAVGADPHLAFSASTIASHAGMSAPSLLLSALIWKAGSASFFWDMSHLRHFAEGRIQAHRRKLLDCLPADIANRKRRLATSTGLDTINAQQEVVSICCNALYALAETVVAQYDGVVNELLIPNAFAVKRLKKNVPAQLQPLFEACLIEVRREANLVGMPDTTAKCVATLQAAYGAICNDVALTLNASLAERYRRLWREFTRLLHRLTQQFPKLVWGAHR